MHSRSITVAVLAALMSIVGCAHDHQSASTPPGSMGSRRSNDAGTAFTSAKAARGFHYVVADAHMHFVNFVQETDGIQAVLKAMDEAGVDQSMISGMSLVKKWDAGSATRPMYYLDDDSRTYWYGLTDEIVARSLLQLDEKDRHRFHAFITGINPTDRNAVDHLRRMLDWHPDLWEGIGEVFGHHDDLTALTYGETARPNNVALDPVYDLAAAKDLPVSVHTNVTSVGMPDTTLFLGELADAVSRHPNTRFIWCHAGISRRIQVANYPAIIEDFLNKHSNVWIDLSWVVYPDYVAPGGKPDPTWVALVERFPTRFMIGSDTVGDFQGYVATIEQYYPFFAALGAETAQKVGHDNFLAILPARVKARLLSTASSASAGATITPEPGQPPEVTRVP